MKSAGQIEIVRATIEELIVSRIDWLDGVPDDFAAQMGGEYQECVDLLAGDGQCFWLIPVLDDDFMLKGWSVGCPNGTTVQIPTPAAPVSDDVAHDPTRTIEAFLRCLTATPESEAPFTAALEAEEKAAAKAAEDEYLLGEADAT